MENIKLYESLTDAVNKLSIRLETRGAIDLIATIAVLAKQEPERFAIIYKSPKVNINEVVAKSLAAISSLQGLIDESFERISDDDLRDAIYFIGEVNDFVLLADNIIELIRQQAYRSFGEAMLSTSLTKLCVSLAGNVTNKIVYDGTAGLCTLTSQLQGAKLELAEVNRAIWVVSKKLLLLKDVAANFCLQDSLNNSDANSIHADLVIMSPPFGVRFNNDQILQIQHASFILLDKEIPKSASDALWVQHALFNTSDTGKTILVTPIGWLFRGGYDAYLRQYLLDHDFVESIIQLPSGLFEGTGIPCAVVILNKQKSSDNQGYITFVDASDIGTKNKRKLCFNDEDVQRIIDRTTNPATENEYAKKIILPEVCKTNNLNVGLYIVKKSELALPSLEEEERKLQQAQLRFEQAQATLNRVLAS